jgi:hypothetical protein
MRVPLHLPALLACLAACPPSGPDLGVDPDTSSSGDTSSTGDTPTSTGTDTDDPGSTSSSATTTGDPGSTSSGSGTEVVKPTCGDGVVDVPEQCDDGLGANKDTAFCTEDCTLNFCGDGKPFLGWELCDLGPANNDLYGSLCGTNCEPSSRCGDAILDADQGEQCDLGPANGSGLGDADGLPCDESCRVQARRAFVTDQAFSADLGGLFGADAKCRTAAMTVGLADPEKFMAYLSTGDTSADERYAAMLGEPTPIITVSGTKLAASYADLMSKGPAGEGINTTETGAALYYAFVATNTNPDGTAHSPDQDCQGWTSTDAADKVHYGYNAFPADSADWTTWQSEGWWLSASSLSCTTKELHLYCFEQ